MSFSMSDIKRKTTTKRDDIKVCYRYVQEQVCLTENLKIGIWAYCNFRFAKRACGKFTTKGLQNLLNDLILQVCGVKYEDLTLELSKQYENELLYQIKRAIFFGATKTLYYEKEDITLNLDLFQDKLTEVPKRIEKDVLNKEEVYSYFGSLVV